MRDGTIIEEFKRLYAYMNQLRAQTTLGITGESIMNQTLRELLIRKGVATEVEINQVMSEVIQKLNTQAEEAQKAKEAEAKKPEIITPTTEQVVQVTEQKIEVPGTEQK